MKLLQTCGYPDPERGDVLEFFTREEAIATQKASAARSNYVYASDEIALADFMVVHYATWVEVDFNGIPTFSIQSFSGRPISSLAEMEAAVHLSTDDSTPR